MKTQKRNTQKKKSKIIKSKSYWGGFEEVTLKFLLVDMEGIKLMWEQRQKRGATQRSNLDPPYQPKSGHAFLALLNYTKPSPIMWFQLDHPSILFSLQIDQRKKKFFNQILYSRMCSYRKSLFNTPITLVTR